MVVLKVGFKQEGDQWVAECLELGTATFGDTLGEVQAEIKELIELHLNTLEQTGRRDAFFKEHKIKLYLTDADVPQNVSTQAPVLSFSAPTTVVFSTTYKVPVPA